MCGANRMASRYDTPITPTSVTRALMGYSRTLPADGGVSDPLLSAKLLDRFSIRKRHLIASGLNFPNMSLFLKIADDVTGRVKGHFFHYLSLLASPGKAAV